MSTRILAVVFAALVALSTAVFFVALKSVKALQAQEASVDSPAASLANDQ